MNGLHDYNKITKWKKERFLYFINKKIKNRGHFYIFILWSIDITGFVDCKKHKKYCS